MATCKLKRELTKMFKWAIMKAFEQNEGDTINLFELGRCVRESWEELSEEGNVVFNETGE